MRYSLKMINKNGYTIQKDFRSIQQAKTHAKFYPLSVFFCWIYDKVKDEMLYQNCYSDNWRKCNNDTFVPHY